MFPLDLIIRFLGNLALQRARKELCSVVVSNYFSPDGAYAVYIRAQDETYTRGRILLHDLKARRNLRKLDIGNVNAITGVVWEQDGVTISAKDPGSAMVFREKWEFPLKLRGWR